MFFQGLFLHLRFVSVTLLFLYFFRTFDRNLMMFVHLFLVEQFQDKVSNIIRTRIEELELIEELLLIEES